MDATPLLDAVAGSSGWLAMLISSFIAGYLWGRQSCPQPQQQQQQQQRQQQESSSSSSTAACQSTRRGKSKSSIPLPRDWEILITDNGKTEAFLRNSCGASTKTAPPRSRTCHHPINNRKTSFVSPELSILVCVAPLAFQHFFIDSKLPKFHLMFSGRDWSHTTKIPLMFSGRYWSHIQDFQDFIRLIFIMFRPGLSHKLQSLGNPFFTYIKSFFND